jgi:RNA polymerase sigma factor (sigma-70 family)
MADSFPDPPPPEPEVDWNAVRRTVRDAIRSQLGRAEPALVEDLTQHALIGVLRALRREPARDLSALARTIARSTAIDEIRRLQRERRGLSAWQSEPSRRETQDHPSDLRLEDQPELLWFLLVEHFRIHNAPCHALAQMYVEQGDWRGAAEALGVSYDAVRKQWSRCSQAFRLAMRRDPGVFEEWLDDV